MYKSGVKRFFTVFVQLIAARQLLPKLHFICTESLNIDKSEILSFNCAAFPHLGLMFVSRLDVIVSQRLLIASVAPPGGQQV